MLFYYGLVAGFVIGWILHLISMNSYKRVLQLKGEKGESELINGKWYKIQKENAHDYQRLM
jgi:uncharacterized membrane protein